MWLSVDKQTSRAPGESPYIFGGDNPIYFIDPDGNFKVPVHQRIIRNAAMEVGGFTQKEILSLEKGVAYTDAASDAGLVDNSSYLHFDNLHSAAEIKVNYERIQGDLTRVFKSETGNEFVVGFYIHAIQDFYAHSNYTELSLEYFGQGTIPTYEEVINDNTGKYDEFKGVLDESLITGKFNLAAEIFGKKGEKLFGYDYEKTHAYLNKDKADTETGKVAEGLAKKETKKVLSEFKKAKTEKNHSK